MIVYTIVGALTFSMLFWFGTSPALAPPVERCVTVAEGLGEIGVGVISIYPNVSLFVQPDSPAGRELQSFRHELVGRGMVIRVCGRGRG